MKNIKVLCNLFVIFIVVMVIFFYFLSLNKAFSAQTSNFDISSAKANTPMPTDTRIKTFVYNPNEIFQVKFLVGYQSIIELQQNEDIELIIFGDSGPFSQPRIIGRRIFLKVNEPGIKTNLTIITDKRTYLFEIMSNEDDGDTDDRITYILRFFYPDISVDTPPSQAKIAQIKLNSNVLAQANNGNRLKEKSAFASVGKTNTEYSYSGKNKRLIPLVIFDNGKRTYFKFNNLDKKHLPIISYLELTNDKKSFKETPLIVRQSSDYLYVDSVEAQFTIRQGQDVVCIFNDGFAKNKVVANANYKY